MADQDQNVSNTNDAEEPLEVSLEDIGPARKCLTIEVPEQRIADKLESGYAKLRTDAVIPGFRKGRAPKHLLQRRFGKSITDDTRNQLLGECYSQAIEKHKLDVIGEPDIKDIDQIKLPDSGPMSFKVEVEISPKVELPDLKDIKINKPKLDVTDQDVKDEIARLQNRFGDIRESSQDTIKQDDYVKADVRILAGENADDDAEEIAHHPESWITVHGKDHDYKGHIAGILIEKLGKQLTGKKKTDTLQISMVGPAGHENEKIKNQPITIKLTIHSINRHEPANIETLLKGWGLESAQQLNDRVREMINERNQRQQTTDMHEQICTHLLENIDLTLPEGLTSRQSTRLLQRNAMELAYKGLDQQEIDAKIAEMRQESEAEARQQLKQFFILDQAAKELDISVSEAEINGRIAMYAMQQNRRPEKMKQEMKRRGELEHLYLQIREQKTLDKILESAQITETAAPTPEKPTTQTKKKTTKKRKKTTTKKTTKKKEES